MKKIGALFFCVCMLLTVLYVCRADAEMSAYDYAVKYHNSSLEPVETSIKEAVDAGVDFNVKDSDGNTVLMLLARFNEDRPQVFSLLIQAGADVNAKNNTGLTALMYAAIESNYPEVLRVLIQAGADVNARDNNGWPVLMWAALVNKNPEVLTVLIQAGADVNAKNNREQTALDLARSRNKPEFVSILEAAATKD